MKKMHIFQIVMGLCLTGLLLAGVLTVQAYHAPLAEPLSIHLSAADAQKAEQARPQTTSGTCNAGGSMVILALAHDSSAWRRPYGADAVRLVKVNYDQQTVIVFAFPRDLVVTTPGLTT